jgi:hypothetical protein
MGFGLEIHTKVSRSRGFEKQLVAEAIASIVENES